MTGTIQQFDYSVDLTKVILWQFNNATNLKALIDGEDAWYQENQTQFWDGFLADTFNLKTANAFGLAIWAIILDAPIIYNLAGAGAEAWGFGAYRYNFDNGNFQTNQGVVVTLSMETARVLLRLRYYKLIGTSCVPEMNRAYADVFAEFGGTAYVTDNEDMTLNVTLTFTPASDLVFMIDNFDILLRPAGVGLTWTVVPPPTFGFNTDGENFSHGNFQGA